MSPWFSYPKTHRRTKRAVVVGAGIAGCQISWHLAKLGWNVTIIEREKGLSTQASGNLAGIIAPQMSATPSPTETFYWQAFDYTISHLKSLTDRGIRLDWFDCGVLQLAHSAREKQRREALMQRALADSFIQFFNTSQATAISGVPCQYPASFHPQAGFINPKSWCQSLLNDSQCNILFATEATTLSQDETGQWIIEQSDGAEIATAEVVVFSNGAALNKLDPCKSLALNHVLGQTSLADTLESDLSPKCAINHEGYLTPAYNHQHVFGATFDRNYDRVEINTNFDQRNLDQLEKHLPDLSEGWKKIRSGHASLRSTTPDRLPYAGGLPDFDYYRQTYADIKHGKREELFAAAQYHDGLYVLGGLGARGLTSSPLCARILSEIIDGSSNTFWGNFRETLHPARFLIKQLKQA